MSAYVSFFLTAPAVIIVVPGDTLITRSSARGAVYLGSLLGLVGPTVGMVFAADAWQWGTVAAFAALPLVTSPLLA